MSSSSSPSTVFSFISLSVVYVLLALACTKAVLLAAAKNVNIVVKLIVGFSWLIGSSVLALVPADVVLSMDSNGNERDNGNGKNYLILDILWQIQYWYCIIAVVLLLPLTSEYTSSGDFTVYNRIKTAISRNVRLYLSLTAVVSIGLLLLVIFVDHMNIEAVVALCMAIMNAIGFLLELFLIGFGLVSIPKELWRRSESRRQLAKCAHELACKEITIRDECFRELELAM